MLRQEINLYHAFERPHPISLLSMWRVLVISCVGFTCLLLLAYLFSLLRVYQLERKSAASLQEATQLEQTFNVEKSKYPSIFFSDNLEESISELEKGGNSQNKLFQSLTNAIPFSKELVAFTEVIVPNVWLTNISIAENGLSITLKGKSLNANALKTFFENLSHAKAFEGFGMNVNNLENADNTLVFQINLLKKRHE